MAGLSSNALGSESENCPKQKCYIKDTVEYFQSCYRIEISKKQNKTKIL